MEYKPKFDIGQTVYVNGEDNPRVIETIKMYKDDDGEIHYLYDFNCGGLYRDEEELSSENSRPKTIYDLKLGDEYFTILETGEIVDVIFCDYYRDHHSISQGNIFLTKNEAKKEVKRREIHQKLKKLSNGYKFGENEKNYLIAYNTCIKDIEIFFASILYNRDTIYFASREDAENAMKNIGKVTLLRDYFGIGNEYGIKI